MGVSKLEDQASGLPFELTYGHGYVVSKEVENLLRTQGGSISCRIVSSGSGDPAWMFFYVHPTGVHLDIIAVRFAGPKLYWRPETALNFLAKYKPFFTVYDNPHAAIPPLSDTPILPGELRASPEALANFRDAFSPKK